jgi:hypothetical protein
MTVRVPTPSPNKTNHADLFVESAFLRPPVLALDSARSKRIARDQHEDLKALAARKGAPPTYNVTRDCLHRIAEAGILRPEEYQGLVDALFPKDDGATDEDEEGDWRNDIERLLRARGLSEDDIAEMWELARDKGTLPRNAVEGGFGGKFSEEKRSMGMDAATERDFFEMFPDAARIVPEVPREERRPVHDAAAEAEFERMFPGISRIGIM